MIDDPRDVPDADACARGDHEMDEVLDGWIRLTQDRTPGGPAVATRWGRICRRCRLVYVPRGR